MDPSSWLLLCRTVRFGDTDAAGVMHFHQLLRWCHEAYEESLERFGIPPELIFPRPFWAEEQSRPSGSGSAEDAAPQVALPIVHCSADYHRPLRVGDPLAIALEPKRLDPGQFEVIYNFRSRDIMVARGLTRHLAIDARDRRRCALPTPIQRWLEGSSMASGVQPCD
ncbi:MAG: thioesterase family protein [Cyanobacteriota bacterium]|nr:thioesterase family protein [Cyanobacteriota bacterium]